MGIVRVSRSKSKAKKSEYQFKVGSKVKVHSNLSYDPLNKQGRWGTVKGYETFKHEKIYRVSFKDGKAGLYEESALHC